MLTVGRSTKESYQCDAISALMQLDKSHFSRMHTFRLEWQPGENGYIHWYGDEKFRFGIEQAGLDKFRTKIPTEPSYVILNTAISTSWGFPPTPVGCTSEYDCKTYEGKCGFNEGFCETLPAEFKIDHVRVYQNKLDPNMYVGCNPKSHPTRRYIAAHAEKYTLSTDRLPLRPVVSGGGKCTSNKDCGEGSCGVFSHCKCKPDWTGPHCLVRAKIFIWYFFLLIYLFIYLFVYLFICLFVYLFICLFVYLFIYLLPRTGSHVSKRFP